MPKQDPVELYDALAMSGRAPDPAVFAARYPEIPDLLERLKQLDALRRDLDLLASAITEAKPRWPEKIGAYKLLAPLGEGGMGAVFLAERQGSTIRCALKLCRSASAHTAKRFAREAEVLAGLAHPRIARVIDYGVQAGVGYLASELISGRSLRQVLDAKDIADWRAAHGLATQLAEALAHVHERGIVHRDVKPTNVMVTTTGEVKLIDFGIARPFRQDSDRLTATGAFVGSEPYAAPEQVRGESSQVGPWTDVWGFGATLYEMLTRAPPFGDATLSLRRKKPDLRPKEWPRDYDSEVPRRLDRLVARALEAKPRRRFADGAALVEALAKVS